MTTRKKKSKYSLSDLMEAVENVINKKINSYQASERYNIPRSTIIHRVYGTRGAKKPTPGRPTELSTAWESRVAALLHEMEKCEFPLTSKEIKELICVYIQKNGLITRFKDDYPGKEWFRGFKRRHRLSVKKPQSVEVARKKASNPFILNNYFDLLERITKELELEDKPQHIYNLDETSFCSDPTKTKVVGLKGYPSTRTTASPGRNNTTVLLASNALGKKIPPLIVFQGKQLWSNCFFENENVNTAYASSRKGWMETKIFENYIKKVFIPAIGPERPVLLIFDGHSTHVDLSVIELLMANQITVLKLPAHSSHILQPLDCSTMKPMKDNWDSELVKWQRLHVGAKLSKSEFARIITKIWNDLNPVIIQNGFRKSGIYPLNRDEIKIIRQQKDRERTNEDRNEVGNEDRQKDRKGKNEDGNEEPPTLMSMCTSMLLKIFNRGKKEILIEDLPKRVKDPSKFIISVSQNTNSSSTKSGSSNVKILSNIELTPTSYQKEKNERISFEELLLETISRSNIPKTSRKCVSKEAEILTYKEAIDRMRKKKDEKEKAEEIKRLNKLKKQQERKDKNKTKKEVQMKININGNKESQCKKDNQVKKRTIWKAKKKRRDSTSSSEDEGEIIYNDESDLDAEEFLEQLKNEDDEEEIIVGIKEESEKGITHDDRKNNNTRQITEEREQGCFLIGEEKLNKNKKRLKQLDKKNENEAILNNKKQKKIQNTISENRTHKKEKQKGKNTAKISNKKKYRKKSIDVSSNSSGSYQSLDESDCEDMDTFFEEILENERDSLVELASKSKNSVSTKSVRTAVKEGRFVLAKFHSSKGKKTFQYVCRIEHINSKKIVVQGFHSYNKSKKKFRVIENDTSIIEEHEIINYLPDPVINGKDYIFPNDVDIIEFK